MKHRLVVLVWLAALSGAFAGDWPVWRGPSHNGFSEERIATNWPEGGPKVLWRASVGTGFSSIAISQGRAYTMGNTNAQDTIWCLDALTGKPLWQHSYPARLDPQFYEGGPSSTPTVDSNRVYTLSKWGDAFCLDAAKGSVIWQHDFGKEGYRSNRWGYAGSPLIWNDLVILNVGTAGTALDRNTGRTVWSNGTNVAGYATPMIFHSGAEESVLIFAAKYLVALDPKTGRELWKHRFETGYDVNNTDPIFQDGRIFLSSYSRGCALLSLHDGKPEVVYENKALRNHLSPGILFGEYLYAFNGEAKTETDFRCIHLPTGELKWKRKDPAYGSMICADGKLIVLSERGELMLAKPSPVEFKPIARAQVLTGTCWTPPALANGLLYLRSAKGEVMCLDLRP